MGLARFSNGVVLLFALLVLKNASSQQYNDDKFNFDMSSNFGGRDYGQQDWNRVTCRDPGQCSGYPDEFPSAVDWNIKDKGNQCKWCPNGGNTNCGNHRQSPINLIREVADTDYTHFNECIDWHWMPYKNDTCTFDDMRDQFEIKRNGLYISTPVLNNGELACQDENGLREWPRLDYSKGFPHWWYLQYTSIVTPSNHRQYGKRYSAEVTLKHVYSVKFGEGPTARQMGYVSLFMQHYDNAERWPYLDKLICNWRLEEEKVRAACGLPPAEPYGRCQLFRGQAPNEDWTDAANGSSPDPPTKAPTTSPTLKPTATPSAAPSSHPSSGPTGRPTTSPTSSPTTKPTEVLSSTEETGVPTSSAMPSDAPSIVPTSSPTGSLPPTSSPTGNPTSSPTKSPSLSPTMAPSRAPTRIPTASPTSAPTPAPTTFVVPEPIVCENYNVDSYSRFCGGSVPCCGSRPGETKYCEDMYDVFGDDFSLIQSACYHCCPDEPIYVDWPEIPEGVEGGPPVIDCHGYDELYDIDYIRMCESSSPCCEPEKSSTGFCQRFYNEIFPGDLLASACFYCCPGGPKILPFTPTLEPTTGPTLQPTTESPSENPSALPTMSPTAVPSSVPTSLPSLLPSAMPSISPTHAPSASPSKSSSPSMMETSPPTGSPTERPSVQPTASPTSSPTLAPTEVLQSIPPEIQCSDYNVDYSRLCYGTHPCCDNPRGDSSYCWDMYENVFPGSLIESACYHCCAGENKIVGPANDIHPEHGKTIQCSSRDINPGRWCKDEPGSCCNNPRSYDSFYCREKVYPNFSSDLLEEVCYNCCHIENSRYIGDEERRQLRGRSLGDLSDNEVSQVEKIDTASRRAALEEEKIPDDAEIIYGHDGQKLVIRRENFKELEITEDEYFEQMNKEYQHRSLTGVIHDIDYENLAWSPYEWMLKVDTEYYFRYEGTQTIPPCRETVFWRVMKDPIRVHTKQMKELQRLIAWRRSPQTCQVDTAGVLLDGGDRARVARDIQYFNYNAHRKVFCECQDWPSKFESDRQWCRRWFNDTAYERFTKFPYNWCDKNDGCAF